MSFIAAANPPTADQELPADNDPWYPAITTAQARAVCRLDGTVTPARLQHALLAAMASVNAELAAWAAARQAQGAATMADVPATLLGGQSILLHHYRRAVYAALQADLAEAYREIDVTPQGAGKQQRVTDKLELKVDEHRRTMRWAVSDILGIRRTTVALV